jgi:hypothetical protein
MARSTNSAWLALLVLAGPALAQPQYPPPPPQPYPTNDPQALVESWYERFLHRNAELAAAGWVEALRRGQSPEQTLSSILGSDEYYLRNGSTPQGFIQGLFVDLTGRQPAPAQMDAWLRRVRFESRQDIAYHMLMRYPQAWQGTAPAYYPDQPPPAVGPNPNPNPYPYPYYNSYEYRRPFRRFQITIGR